MGARMIEHRAVVQCVEGDQVLVAMETGGCASCRPVTLMAIPVTGGVKAGDSVLIGLPEAQLTLSALLGYFFPTIAMLVGAWVGAGIDGSDSTMALGAIVSFLLSLAVVRLAIALAPRMWPASQLIPLHSSFNVFPKEHIHD